MIGQIYKSAFGVISKKPLRLWGIVILASIVAGIVSAMFGIIPGAAIFLGSLIGVGKDMVFLHAYRGRKVEPYQLFDAFKDGKTASKVIKGMFYRALMLSLWLLIPIAGFFIFIVRSYRYRLTSYILMQEDPENPYEAYKISKRRTKGFCGKMFLADLLPMLCVTVILGVFPRPCSRSVL